MIKTVIICHEGSVISQHILPKWLCSFTELCGIIIIRENSSQLYKRVKYEIKRSGYLRFIDIVLFRLYYKFCLAAKDKLQEKEVVSKLEEEYPQDTSEVPRIYVTSPNCAESIQFIRQYKPDMLFARCKVLLKSEVFKIPTIGTFVLHPGICPEYRNAHGCFWALANRDLKKVGVTLLKIDEGIDTGPIYGYYSYEFDEINESHLTIQNRVLTENLKVIQEKLIEIYHGKADPIDTKNRPSAVWGQPWLTKYFQWKHKAKCKK